MNLAVLIAEGLNRSRASGVPDSSFYLLLAETLELSIAELHTRKDLEISASREKAWEARLSQLLTGVPPQYISGRAWFWGFPLSVTPQVLIPRPETEGLVELALPRLNGQKRLLDCCCGSGAIAIALKKLVPQAQIAASDICPAAVELAEKNAKALQAEIDFFVCDLFPDGQAPFDLIICNPPYVSESEYAALPPLVKDREPSLALVSGPEGLNHISRILAGAKRHLEPDGYLLLEHGDTQRKRIVAIATEHHWQLDYAGDDLDGKPRYLIFRPSKPVNDNCMAYSDGLARGING